MSEIIYWKNGHHPCIDQACSDDAIPIVGKFDGTEDYSQIRWIAQKQETALDYDQYHKGEVLTSNLSVDEKVRIITEKRDQTPGDSVHEVYRGVDLVPVSKALERFRETDSEGKILSPELFLPSITPSKFNFSGVFLTNHGFQGVLHSFLRHHDKWRLVESFVDETLNKMPQALRGQIQQIANAYYMSNARSEIHKFMSLLDSLTTQEYNDVRRALNEVQVVLVKALQDKLTEYSNYRGEGVNEKGQLQTYFQMKPNLVAVVGYSRELFKAETIFDSRPFRTIITIYFIDDAECQRRTVMKSY